MDNLEALIPLVLTVLIGFITGKRKLFSEDFPKFLNKFLFNIAIPLYIIGSLSGFNKSEVINFLPFILVNFSILTLLYLYIFLTFKFFKSNPVSGASTLMTSLSGNVLYFGFPILLGLFGPEHISYGIMYVSFVLFSDYVGIFLITKLTGKKFDPFKQIFDFVRTPIVLSSILGLVFLILNLKLPDMILQTTVSFGNIISTLALFSLGMYFAGSFKLKNIRFPLFISFNKLFLLPLITYFVVFQLYPLPQVAAQTSVILSAMPSAVVNLIISDNYGTDRDITIGAILITSIISLVTASFWSNLVI